VILDIGSGNDSSHIARGDVCIDIMKRPVNMPETFICSDAKYLPFANETFEQALMYNVIEHIDYPSLCLQEIYRVLKPEGTISIVIPNVYHYRKVIKVLFGKNPHDDNKDHISCWAAFELQNLLRENGFVDITVSYQNYSESRRKKLDKIATKVFSKIMGNLHLLAVGVKKI
jgi:ubiquinone/menaquinone biosynthesis C-methylase UbiE